MAMTASLSLSRTSVGPGTPVNGYVTVSNSGASDVSVTSLRPSVSPIESSASVGAAWPAQPRTVPAGGSVVFSFSLCGFAPLREGDAGSYGVSAVVYCSDGSVVIPETAALAVSSPFDPVPEMALGHLRFDSNTHSGLVALA